MSILEPAEQGTDMTMEVVPSMFCFTTFNKNVWVKRNRARNEQPHAQISVTRRVWIMKLNCTLGLGNELGVAYGLMASSLPYLYNRTFNMMWRCRGFNFL